MVIKKSAEVVIVGGGVMGAGTAFHLARRGIKDVVLLEKGLLASGPTGRSVAHLRPYHGVPETRTIIREALRFYADFKEITGGDAGFNKVGRVWVVPQVKRRLMEQSVADSQKSGIQARFISLEEFGELVPSANTGEIEAVAFFPDAGYANPTAVTTSFAARAREMGVQMLEETTVTGIDARGGRVRSVATSRGTVSTPVVVNAAGIWGRDIGRMVGVETPIIPTRHQGLVFRLPWDLVRFAPIFHDGRNDYVFRCSPDNLMRVMDTQDITHSYEVDPDTLPGDADRGFLEEALVRGSETLPALKNASYRGGYSCAFDMTPDDSPIIEEAEECKGFYSILGWSGLGMQQSPVVTDLMAELIATGKTTLVDVSVFSSRRFKENRPLASAWLFE